MAKKSISRRSKERKEKQHQNVAEITTSHVPLCALGEVIKEKHLLAYSQRRQFLQHELSVNATMRHLSLTSRLSMETFHLIFL